MFVQPSLFSCSDYDVNQIYKMKLTFRYFALAVVGVLMSGCAEEVEVVQPAVNGTVTMKTTISLDGKSATRALTEAGVKTFAAGDQIAVIYEQGTGTSKAVSVALTAADIDASDAHKATFTVALTNPKANGKVRYIYPASMAADDVSTTTPDNAATINYTALATQDGTFASLASTYDLAVYDGTMGATATLPESASLTNPLTIGKFTIKNTTDADITNTITKLTIGDGTNTYTVNRTAAAGPIYVAMKPIASTQNVTVNATAGTDNYYKSVTGKDLAASNIYDITVKVIRKITYLKYTSATDSSYVDVLTTNATIWTGTVSTGDLNVSAGTYVVEGEATCTGRLILKGEVNLILTNGSKLTVDGDINAVSTPLNIYGQGISSSMGQLIVNSSSGNSAIKVNDNDLTIHGGKVVANAMDNGGHGIYTYGGSFTLYNGVLDASANGAGNGLYSTSANPINIYNGTVTARGGKATSSSFGGQGISTENGGITIKDAVVKAYGGAGSSTQNGGAGILSNLDIEISGKSDVYAKGGKSYNAIYSESGDITISGGKVDAVAGENASPLKAEKNITITTGITSVELTNGSIVGGDKGRLWMSTAIGSVILGSKSYTSAQWSSKTITDNTTYPNYESSGLDLARSDEVLTFMKHE